MDHKLNGFDFKHQTTTKELNQVITAVDELKDRGGRTKNPSSDLQPQVDDLNKRLEAFKKDFTRRMNMPPPEGEEGDDAGVTRPFNDCEIQMLKNQIELCITQRRDLVDLVQQQVVPAS